MKKKWLRLLLLGIGSYLLFLVVTFPAAYAYKAISGRLNGVSLSGIEGTLWSGSARHLQAGKIQLQEIHWQVRFWPLLMGRAELALDSRDKGMNFETYLGSTLGGKRYLRQLQGRFPVAAVQRMTPYPVPVLDGELVFEGVDVALAEGKLVEGEGVARWQNAAIKMGTPIPLGSFSLELKTEGQQIGGQLRDTGGPLQAEGSVAVTPDGAYHFKGVFTPRDGSSDLARKLRMLGAPDASGGYTLEYSGKLSIPAL